MSVTDSGTVVVVEQTGLNWVSVCSAGASLLLHVHHQGLSRRQRVTQTDIFFYFELGEQQTKRALANNRVDVLGCHCLGRLGAAGSW